MSPRKILTILKGTLYNIFGMKKQIKKQRLVICNKCAHKDSFMNIEICDVCGCVIKSKTTIINEKCPRNKW